MHDSRRPPKPGSSGVDVAWGGTAGPIPEPAHGPPRIPSAAPSRPYEPPRSPKPEKGGSYALGFLAGVWLSLLGYLYVLIRGGPEARRGALHGLILGIIAGVAWRLFRFS